MTTPVVPTHPATALLGTWVRTAPGRRDCARWPGRRLATVLVFAGGLVTGAGGVAVLPTAGHSPPRLEAARGETSSVFGLPIGPASPQATVVPPTTNVRAPSAPPVEVVLPSIRTRSRLVGLRLNRDGTVEVPTDYAVAGWYRDGPAPGDPGAALILGHVDSTKGPAVFYRLGELRRGDAVLVRRADGTTARFIVSRLATYPKSRFPAAKVYAATARPELRLVTCTGDFANGHYLDNLVVFAEQAVPPPVKKPAARPAKPAVKKLAPKPAKPAVKKLAPKPAGRQPVTRFAVKEPLL